MQQQTVKKAFSGISQTKYKENKKKLHSGNYILLFAGITGWQLIGKSKLERMPIRKEENISFTISSAYKASIWKKYNLDPNTLDQVNKFNRQIEMAVDASRGSLPFIQESELNYVRNLDELDKLVEYCETTGICFFDFETFPKQPGLTKKADIKEHSLDFTKALPSVLGISFQPGSGYCIPLYHCESWFNVGEGEITDIRLNTRIKRGKEIIFRNPITGDQEVNRCLYINGTRLQRYNGEDVIFPTDSKEEDLNIFQNWEYCLGGEVKDMIVTGKQRFTS